MTESIEPGKLYYSIGEVAEIFAVNTSLIRYWEKEFDILQPKKNRKGNRQFTPKDVENIRLIHFLTKKKGYTIEGARMALKEKRSETEKTMRIIKRLEKIRHELLEMQKKL